MIYIYNGSLIKQAELQIPVVENGSFWYGDGFFEAIKWRNGRILFAEQHWERIITSCAILKMKNPFGNVEAFLHQVGSLASEDGNPVQRIKLMLWRNTWQSYQPENDHVEFLIHTTPLTDVNYSLNSSGLRLSIYRENLKSVSRLGNVKSTSSQLYVLATLYTQSLGLDDSILLNTRKNILETSRSNIAIVMDGIIYTPPLNEGCLDGIMRRVLLEICNEHEIPIQQEPIAMDMLQKATEAFTTSAIRGIQWVQSIDEQTFDCKDTSAKLSYLLNEKVD